MHNRSAAPAQPPRLLVVAHGTASAASIATTTRLVRTIAAARRGTSVDLCFLDVAEPRLPQALERLHDQSVVLVPLLLSTGYHVQSDIPSAAAGHPRVRVARHLGPHPLLVDVLVDRLPDVHAASTVLVGAGSSRAEAADELAAMGRLLAARLGQPVAVHSVTDDLPAGIAGAPSPTRVATYLLAEGRFADVTREAAGPAVPVADPLGVHPALVELVWLRYDDAQADWTDATPRGTAAAGTR